MTLPQISVKAKDQETKANPPLSASGKTKEALLIKTATSYYCHIHNARHPETHNDQMDTVTISKQTEDIFFFCCCCSGI